VDARLVVVPQLRQQGSVHLLRLQTAVEAQG
jgi:hypothetical protein